MKRFFIAIAALSAIAVASAQSVPDQKLSWIPPTTNTDNTPITAMLSYRVYMGASGSGKVLKVDSIVGANATVAGVPATGTCFDVTAVANGVESSHSTEVCVKVPNAPTGLTVTVVIVTQK